MAQPGSSSVDRPDYWWHRARTGLLEAALGEFLGRPVDVLDVGSADGPSVGWMRGEHQFSVDLDPRGLAPGRGVLASLEALPFADECFDVVGAFDVVEHCPDEARALAEIVRVLRPGGRLLCSVPAYEWAWTEHDVRAGHHRRYTRRRLLSAVVGAGLEPLRCTHGFAGVFPFFALERASRRVRRPRSGTGSESGAGADGTQQLPHVSPLVDRVLTGLCGLEEHLLGRHDLPFGSSVFLAARRPGPTGAG